MRSWSLRYVIAALEGQSLYEGGPFEVKGGNNSRGEAGGSLIRVRHFKARLFFLFLSDSDLLSIMVSLFCFFQIGRFLLFLDTLVFLPSSQLISLTFIVLAVY